MSTRVLIIEDETFAADKLKRLLERSAFAVDVLYVAPSVVDGVNFLKANNVDLILSDIHLTDGLSFEIFHTLKTDTPVIFITAYDQYAIEAFKTNSIDYLLKPVKFKNLEDALLKYQRLNPDKTKEESIDYGLLLKQLNRAGVKYKDRFLVEASNGELTSIAADEVAYFYADGKYTLLVSKAGRKFFSTENISTLNPQLDPKSFFQLNRKFIVHISSIGRIIKYSKSRLKLELQPGSDVDVIVSTDRTPDFKSWLGK